MAEFPQPVYTFVTKTAAYTAVNGDNVLADTTTTGAFTLTLPASPGFGATASVRNITGTNAVTVKSSDGSKVNGVTGTTGIGYTTVHTGASFAFDGTNWWIVAG